jgi:hypothetical protein
MRIMNPERMLGRSLMNTVSTTARFVPVVEALREFIAIGASEFGAGGIVSW